MRTALLLLLLAPAVAFGQAGRFLLSTGEVTVVRGAQEIRAVAGTSVEPGDTIRVGPRSSVQVRMSDGSIIALRANTVFRIDEYVYSERGGDASRSIFSLLKGGMRTVSGAIARQQSDALVRTSARSEPPSGPRPAPDEKAEPRGDASESKLFGLIKAPMRTVAGALTLTRHAVRTPTSTIGVRGTHYTVVHCDNDCVEPRRTSVASAPLAQSDAASPGLGNLAPNGTYGGVSNGRIVVINNRDDTEIGVGGFFYVANADSLVQSLIAPPGFLYDRLEAQARTRGQTAKESTATMARSGLNAESRPSETPVPPAPPRFVVTEERTERGALAVVPGAPDSATPPAAPKPPKAPNTAFLSALTNANGGPGTVGAFVDASAVNLMDIGGGKVLLSAFNVPAGSTVNPATGSYSGSGIGVQDRSFPNALGAYWGIWFDGSATDASGTTTFLSPGKLFHYLVGPNTPPEVIAAKQGSFGFDLVANTLLLTNSDGNAGSMSNTRFTVDFTARTVTFPVTSFVFSGSGQNWNFSAPTNPSPIMIQPGRGAFVESTATGSCVGGSCTTFSNATLARTATFMGPAGDHLGVALHGRTTGGTGSGSMQGTGIFACNPGPC